MYPHKVDISQTHSSFIRKMTKSAEPIISLLCIKRRTKWVFHLTCPNVSHSLGAFDLHNVSQRDMKSASDINGCLCNETTKLFFFFIWKYRAGSFYWLLIAVALSWRSMKVFFLLLWLWASLSREIEHQSISAIFCDQGLYENELHLLDTCRCDLHFSGTSMIRFSVGQVQQYQAVCPSLNIHLQHVSAVENTQTETNYHHNVKKYNPFITSLLVMLAC